MYYEQEMTQAEIAEQIGVSRPMISRMIKEAHELGIVTIQVHAHPEDANSILNKLRNFYNLRGGIIIPDASTENVTNERIAASILDFILNFSPRTVNIGFGWGYLIGIFVKALENADVQQQLDATVFPLIGNSSVSNRDYHSNEIVRVFAEKTGAAPIYLHAPAFFESEQEMRLFQEADSFGKVTEAWSQIDTAVVNLGNYPSAPDYATVIRYGDRLTTQKAVGRMLFSHFDANGVIIRSPTDYSIQIPIPDLARCRNVVAVCSVALQAKALIGALRTGLITHLITAESVARQALETTS